MEEFLLANGYQLGKTIGEGTYSKVKEALSLKHQKKVAIKIIDKKEGPEGKRWPRRDSRPRHHPSLKTSHSCQKISFPNFPPKHSLAGC